MFIDPSKLKFLSFLIVFMTKISMIWCNEEKIFRSDRRFLSIIFFTRFWFFAEVNINEIFLIHQIFLNRFLIPLSILVYPFNFLVKRARLLIKFFLFNVEFTPFTDSCSINFFVQFNLKLIFFYWVVFIYWIFRLNIL